MKGKQPEKALKPVTTESARCGTEGMLQAPEMPRDPCEEALWTGAGRLFRAPHGPFPHAAGSHSEYPEVLAHSRGPSRRNPQDSGPGTLGALQIFLNTCEIVESSCDSRADMVMRG